MIPADQIARLPWLFFATLTFASTSADGNRLEVPKPAIRSRMLFQWLRQASRLMQIRLEALLFVAREEQGELGGRYHFHVLLGVSRLHRLHGASPWANSRSLSYALENLWRKRCGPSGGIADVRQYAADLSGVAYVLKGLDNRSGFLQGANNYEVPRFRETGDVVFSGGMPAVELARHLISALSVARELALASSNRRDWKARDFKVGTRDRSTSGNRSGIASPARLAHPYAPEPGQGLI